MFWSTVSCLEIRAGNAAFLDEMKKLGTKTFYYNLSIDVTERLSKHHSKYHQNSKYDFLILRHVLEHTTNPFNGNIHNVFGYIDKKLVK